MVLEAAYSASDVELPGVLSLARPFSFYMSTTFHSTLMILLSGPPPPLTHQKWRILTTVSRKPSTVEKWRLPVNPTKMNAASAWMDKLDMHQVLHQPWLSLTGIVQLRPLSSLA